MTSPLPRASAATPRLSPVRFRRGTLAAFCTLASLAFVSTLSAQTAAQPPADDDDQNDDTVVLSPFEVDASQDKGYRATSTLAGSRINTSLRDVASSISVVTTEFMRDTAAVDINDVLAYMGNTESTINYTDAPAQGIGGYDDRVATNPQTANRVRGLTSATLTRDYFISIGGALGFDSYNIDRITINRGPNSILFGLGQPSGIVDYSPKKANLGEHLNEVSLRYGSNDDMRATFDFNRVLVDDTFAVRVVGLWSDRGFAQEPAYFEDSRLYLTATYKPFAKTTLQVGYEIARQDQNNPNSITPIDHVTSWIQAGRPTWNPATDTWSARPDYFNTSTGGSFLAATNPDGGYEYLFQEAEGENVWATFWQPQRAGVFVQTSLGLPDNRYAPLHDLNFRPTVNEYDLDTLTLTWDQEIFDDLFLNVAYIHEDLDQRGLNFTRSNQFGIYVDVNETLPDGSPNPHFGELFTPQRSLDNLNEGNNGNESLRGTITYELDLTQRTDWWRHLGRHTFTAYAERREADFVSNVYNGTRTGNPAYLSAADRINNEGWQYTRLRYLGGTPEQPARYGTGVPASGVSGVPSTYFDSATGQWATDTFGDFWALKRRDVGENTVTSSAQVWQSYFLDGRIVGLAGWRQDKNEEANKSSTSIDPATGVVRIDDTLPDPSKVSGDTVTLGLVVHPTKWLSLHYNESENFVAAAANVNIFGDPIAPPSGTGKDYGFSLELLDGDLNVRVNWYEVEQTNSRISNQGPDIAAQWELPWFDQVVIPRLAEQYGLSHTEFFSPVTWGDNNIEETADVVSEGVEIELTYNPTDNWRIMANVSQQKASRTNIGPGLTRWIEEVLPVWQSQPWWDGPATYDAGWGLDGNLQDYFDTFNSGRILATYKAEEGKLSPQLREWRVNLITNYTFTEGALRGWNFGGALRWEDEAAIGFPAITDVINGTETLVGLDIDNPYTDGEQVTLDLWAGYARRIWQDRVNWSIQLNVRDVTGEKGFQPINKDSNGQSSVFRIEFGPTWYLTSTFSW